KGFDDLARAKGGSFEQSPVNVRRGGRQGRADEQSTQIRIGQGGAVAIPPIKREQPMFTRFLPRRLFFQQAITRNGALEGVVMVKGRERVFNKPSKDIPRAALSPFVGMEARDNAILYHAT